MSSYSKLIIFIVALILISAVIVFIDSSIDSINKTMPDISDAIVNGDKDYNDAVNLVNDKNYMESMAKAESAENNYNSSRDNLENILDKYSTDLNDIQKEYINTVIDELNLKIQATEKLKVAIGYFEVNSNYTGTSYASEANDLIYEAVKYQNERDSIVINNSDLFKQNFII